MSGGFFKGTSVEQDSRFGDKQKQLLSKMHFPPEYDTKVDLARVRIEVLKPWMASRLKEMLGFEDEVVVDLAYNSLETHAKAAVAAQAKGGKGGIATQLDPRELQITLTGFLEKQAKPFVLELWKLLISAAANPAGIPQQLLDEKKNAILAEQQKQRDMIAAAAATARANVGLAPGFSAGPTPTMQGASAAAAPPAFNPDGTRKRASRFGPAPSVRPPSQTHAHR